ncbi:TRAP-type C4-dicarboxylate transport system, substrate-binding protein [Lutimaribacter pacificus]|uniref:TRAP-type C4-dicarboxylate transport system, substrate-binding protein n=1 Tax=Lutimaribacter pacificus TaxID=391948 RepID=A0A1H0L7I2_9RHOB|nr:C4-dicarboxylate TRAP transporter substrate-binding protein [Lutimaribacter pacificus]SDO64219.1 TRAP-type C4-dicarboxylate transport system, substrate-binding protein [Lutimaribacter pacificus]SHK70186.1 TRAP-type C4-dicarboxylate transport system, substrate-binding protein [Lutimaribacter pacificus]
MGLGKTLLATAVVLAASGAHAQTVLRFSDYGPNRGARAAALEWFAEELATRTDGAVSIEFHWGGSLLGGRDTLGGIASGVADIGTVVGFFTPKELELYSIGDLPVANSDIQTGMRAIYDLSTQDDRLTAEFDAAGVRYLTNYTTGPVELICRSEITTLDEFQGLKIRASGPYGDTLKRLGAEIVTMSQADVYQALDSGLIDCNQNYYYSMRAYRQYEVAPYVLELNWGQNMSFGIFMNPASFDMLDASQQEILTTLASEFVDYVADAMTAEIDDAKEAMVAGIDGSSITVTPLPEEDRARLLEVSQEAISDWLNRAGDPAAEVLDAYQALLAAGGSEGQ